MCRKKAITQHIRIHKCPILHILWCSAIRRVRRDGRTRGGVGKEPVHSARARLLQVLGEAVRVERRRAHVLRAEHHRVLSLVRREDGHLPAPPVRRRERTRVAAAGHDAPEARAPRRRHQPRAHRVRFLYSFPLLFLSSSLPLFFPSSFPLFFSFSSSPLLVLIIIFFFSSSGSPSFIES